MVGFLERYIGRLPHGLSSYPSYVQKASVLRGFLSHVAELGLDGRTFPRELSGLFETPPPATAWIPEVHMMGVCLAVADEGGLSEDAFVAVWEGVNRTVLSSPLYKVLMRVASPLLVVKGASRRWRQFHEGIEIDVETQPKGACIRLLYPPHLIDPLMAKAYTTAFHVALQMAGGDTVQCSLDRYTAKTASYLADWS